ncbi:hypothetical protein CDV31_006287 [Fusarium ambrosium]|uniref:Uncharacterized protein n=1 Tax=Fusarium ambrosium TaxID=131363 RepID=A0A428UDQ9_9HYPO|nr:hypothetical protein CDV31_006287 [Fusarium ambrosium]
MPGERTGAPKRLQDKGPRRSRPTENPPSRVGHASGSPPDPNPPRVMDTVSETARNLESSFRLLESRIQSLQQQVDDERVARVADYDRLQQRIEGITAQLSRRDELRRENQELRARVEQLVAERPEEGVPVGIELGRAPSGWTGDSPGDVIQL